MNRLYAYQTLERVTRADGVRHYRCPRSQSLVPSVTTILSATADKTALEEWKKRVGEERAEVEKQQATGLGSLLHQHIENHVMGIERPRGNNLVRQLAARMADQIIEKGLCHVDEVWGQEVGLYYPTMFAGTTDLCGIYQGRQAIMDHKTAKKLRKRGMIEDYFLQLGAYSLCHNHLFGTEIDTGVIFMVARDLKFQSFVIQGQEMEHYQQQFLLRLEAYCDGGS